MARRRWLLGLCAVVALALALRLGFWLEIRPTPLDSWHTWEATDMATYLEQARQLREGSWLAPEPYHPYHSWQSRAGGPEDWLRWYGPGTFHQAPLYSYGLALAGKLSTHAIGLVKLVQILLGGATCAWVAMVGRRVADATVGLLAGSLAAVYGPVFHLEAHVLREGPAVCAAALLLWLAVRHAGLPREASRGRWLLSAFSIGALLGLFAMFHEAAVALAAAAALVVTVHAVWVARARAVLALAAMLAGSLIAFAPLLARNLAVGAPPFATSSRLGVNLAFCNMSTAEDSGITFSAPGPELQQIMDRSGGSLAGILREVWRGYEGDRLRFFRNWLNRLAAIWLSVELPDNTSFAFHRDQSAIVRASLSFGTIFAPGAAMIVAILSSLLRGRRAAQPWHRREMLALLAFLPPLVAAMSLVLPQSRYRLLLVPPFLVLASLFFVVVVRSARTHRLARAAGLLVLAVAFFFVQGLITWPRRAADRRPNDYVIAAQLCARQGRSDASVGYLQRAIQIDSTRPVLRILLADALARTGRPEEAVTEYERVLQQQPDNAEVRSKLEALRTLLRR
jgi:hypothetical protein